MQELVRYEMQVYNDKVVMFLLMQFCYLTRLLYYINLHETLIGFTTKKLLNVP